MPRNDPYTRYARMAVQMAEAGESVSALTLREIAKNLDASERDLIERAARLAEVAR